ncbi:hypothetical protein RUMLAC_01950 [[Ruminococcus] lactaris ATCC 29176]|uniref:Uncharacterized protein n=1 Tax=[Ruminococcus] lactaris ATCC 29176 TaxID=471875 RepID=B5CR50_9FIRM|nr:hypothetical protein RUMLAC_01950 [[Ruminococcus] lactaris ATCC 29176]
MYQILLENTTIDIIAFMQQKKRLYTKLFPVYSLSCFLLHFLCFL